MITRKKISSERKMETQQRIIEQFEIEKAQLLDTIETLTFEKEFDKKNNSESIKLAKSLIESMETQMITMTDCIKELESYKAEYRKCIAMMKDSLSDFNRTVNTASATRKTCTAKPPFRKHLQNRFQN